MLKPSFRTEHTPLLPHGGQLRKAAAHYGIPLSDWLDLSTGINPNAWPVPTLPPTIWSRLPEDDDGLEAAAQNYYRAADVLPIAGSQAAIQTLPRLRAPGRVATIHPGYAEHAHAWRSAGHSVFKATVSMLDEMTQQVDVVVLAHPNNPTGTRFSHEQLLAWHDRLATRGGWLVVDEAFMDATPQYSLAAFCSRPGLIVLRSLGKFFGLAGARVGFVCAEKEFLNRLHSSIGPWTVAASSRYIATAALLDKPWQTSMRQRLTADSDRLSKMLDRHGLSPQGGCAMFQWIPTLNAIEVHTRLARFGILTRLFEEISSLRFGLPGNDNDWRRLDNALAEINAREPAEAEA